MAHLEQAYFCEQVRLLHPRYFYNNLVVDIGSLDINGSNRQLFSECLYLGVDLSAGKNVDLVCKGHELRLPDASVDVIISTEVFEHDIHYSETISNIIRMLKPGGLFIFTCATSGRPEHGTRSTTLQDAPFLEDAGWADYYKNLTEEDIREVFNPETVFSDFQFSVNDKTHDLYFWGIKQGSPRFRDDYSFLLWESRIERDSIRTKLVNIELESKINDLQHELNESSEKLESLLAETSLSVGFQQPVASPKNNLKKNLSEILSGREGEWHSLKPLEISKSFKNRIHERSKFLKKRRFSKHQAIIRSSYLFDDEWYKWAYSDIEQSGVDPETHFLEFGAKEGRNPSPYFDTKFYLFTNPDVVSSGLNPLVHFILHGRSEKRACSPLFKFPLQITNCDSKVANKTNIENELIFELGKISLTQDGAALFENLSGAKDTLIILAEHEH